jgi:NAD(P)-dependent dehydrogenase (short-subunit alcohol dehydrogenase family)
LARVVIGAKRKRVLLLTGAGGRLGQELCSRLRGDYDIAAVYRTRLPRQPNQDDLFIDPLCPGAPVEANEDRIFTIHADLRAQDAAPRIVELALAKFDRIDVIVHAAVFTRWGSLVEHGPALESIEEQFRVNVTAPVLLCAEVARSFWIGREHENRAWNRNVIMMASTAGVHVYRGLGQGVYSASKAALIFMTKHIADEYDKLGVRANALAPNAFPAIIPTETVVDGVLDLDQGRATGNVVVLDRDTVQTR